MKNMPDLKLVVLRGTLSDLVVASGEEEFIQTTAHKAAGAGVGAGLALSGAAGAASAAVLAMSNSADSVQFFTCVVDGKRIAGRFSKVWFKNGDAVEVVGQMQEDGSYMAQAVRRKSDRTLWMAPHCSRGNWAHWSFTLKMIPMITFLTIIAMILFFWLTQLISPNTMSNDGLWFLFWLNNILSLVVGLYFPIKIGYKWRPFVNIAEQVFKALGYADPSSVDMEKQDSLFWKKYAKPTDKRQAAPWVFRYVSEK